MKKVMTLKKKKTFKNKFNFILLSLFMLTIIAFLCLKIVSDRISPILLEYAEIESKKLASIIINKSIEKHMATSLVVDDLYKIVKNNEGEIVSVDFNTAIVNKVLSGATNNIQMNLRNLEEGNIDLIEMSDDVLIYYDKENLKKGIVFKIPCGIVFNNALLTNVGPKIPVRFTLVGDVLSGIKTNITNYGINNALLQISVNLKISEKVILPLSSKIITIETDVPIAIKMIQGTVPNYYSNGISSEFSIPLNEKK